MKRSFFLFLLAITALFSSDATTLKTTPIDEKTVDIMLTIPIASGDALYADYLACSVDSPNVTLSSWQAKNNVVEYFDPVFKETKTAFTTDTIIHIQAQAADLKTFDDCNLTLSYYLKSKGHHVEEVLALKTQQDEIVLPTALEATIEQTEIVRKEPAPAKEPHCVRQTEDKEKRSFSQWISDLMEHTNSTWLRLVLVFLLGILMSLTPCIYPMIPITAGVIQSQASKSFLYNVLLSLSYTMGIATTFALLGLLAAYTGHLFGSLLTHPAVVVPIILLLVYLALSMIGLYEMYIPRFMQPKAQNVKGGSLISSFFFGVASGTFASPCLSPGLACLLTVVAGLKNIMFGFVLLFVFGVGLSVPLLIVGSFSSSLAVLPRAGMWMVEIKRIFGFVMLGMCFYFLGYIMPIVAIWWMIAAFLMITGIFYLKTIGSHDTKFWRNFKNAVGICCIIVSVVVAYKAYTYNLIQSCMSNKHGFWLDNYQAALAKAKQERKPLMVDIGAPFCSICKAIDNTLFIEPEVITSLQQQYISVKVDGSDTSSPCNGHVAGKFGARGFPTILLINPYTEEVLKRWGGELYGIKIADFVTALEQVASQMHQN